MTYYFAKIVEGDVPTVRERVQQALSNEGFGVLTEIDVQATMKKKLGESMRPYVILGACNPGLAFKALSAESNIGTMLPCNVIVRQTEEGTTEVAAVDPVASMQAVDNPGLAAVAQEVRTRLSRVVESL